MKYSLSNGKNILLLLTVHSPARWLSCEYLRRLDICFFFVLCPPLSSLSHCHDCHDMKVKHKQRWLMVTDQDTLLEGRWGGSTLKKYSCNEKSSGKKYAHQVALKNIPKIQCKGSNNAKNSGAPNDGFPLITLKTLFRHSRVLLDL